MSYKDAKIRICPMCGKNIKQCQCQNNDSNKNQKKIVRFVSLTQQQYDNLEEKDLN